MKSKSRFNFCIQPLGFFGNILASGHEGTKACNEFMKSLGLNPLDRAGLPYYYEIGYHHKDTYSGLEILIWLTRLTNGNIRSEDSIKCMLRRIHDKRIVYYSKFIQRDFASHGVRTEKLLQKVIIALYELLNTYNHCHRCNSTMSLSNVKTPNNMLQAKAIYWICNNHACRVPAFIPRRLELELKHYRQLKEDAKLPLTLQV